MDQFSFGTYLADLAERLQDLPLSFKELLEGDAELVARVVVDEAKLNHRFKNRTGRLESAIKYMETPNGAEVYLDTGVAPYAQYVHDGTKYIEADPFLSDAADSRQVDEKVLWIIDSIMEEALNRI